MCADLRAACDVMSAIFLLHCTFSAAGNLHYNGKKGLPIVVLQSNGGKGGTFPRVGNLLICSLLIRSFAQIAQIKWVTVSDLLRLLRTKEQLWANHLGHSWQMSDREWFAQVAHDKWENERIVHLLYCSQKTSNSLKKMWLRSNFSVRFLYVFLQVFF